MWLVVAWLSVSCDCGHVTLFASVRGVWSSEECRDMWLQLDPTEGPNRERRRMVRVPRNILNRYILQQQEGAKKEGGWVGGVGVVNGRGWSGKWTGLEWWVGGGCSSRWVGGWGLQ